MRVWGKAAEPHLSVRVPERSREGVYGSGGLWAEDVRRSIRVQRLSI